MPVHLFGQPADMDPILEIARRRNLIVVEDAAQAHGAEYKGRRAGGIGDLGCFSFYPSKNLGAYGEGGAVVTNDPAYTRTIRMLRDAGAEKRYHHVVKGYNYRLEGMQGAILGVKLRRLEDWTRLRQQHAAEYTRLLAGSVRTPEILGYARHVFHVYAIRSPRRDEIHETLQARGVQSAIHYPIPLHLLEAWSDLGYRRGDFPVSEQAASEVLSLPMYPELSQAQIEAVVDGVRAASSQFKAAELKR
jgi:dTDP-4-amino-4,6-dideoxygalactose transaminase